MSQFVPGGIPREKPRGLRLTALVVGACAAAMGAVTWTARATACTVERMAPVLEGYPADAATEVPTDVVPIYEVYPAHLDYLIGGPPYSGFDAEGVFVLRSEDGQEVPLQGDVPYNAAVTLRPAVELEPHTTYLLEATLPTDANGGSELRTLSFTTGSGRAAPPSPPSGIFLEHYSFTVPARSSCDPSAHGTCVAIGAGQGPVVAVYVDEFGQESQWPPYFWMTSSSLVDLSGIEQGTNYGCVRLRTRAPNGVESEPVLLCGADAPLVELHERGAISCSAEGLVFDDDLLTPEEAPDAAPAPTTDADSGCSTTPLPASSATSVWLMLAAAGGVMRARRRRHVR